MEYRKKGENMKLLIKTIILVLFLSIFTGCNRGFGGCPDAEIEWIDFVMINDIKYQSSFSDYTLNSKIETGKKVGEVKYKLADHACSNHKAVNGDAAFLEKGTPIYEVKGYPAALIVTAEGKLFIANENKSAKKVSDLYPVEGLVKNIYIASEIDGKRLKAFSEENKNKFLKEWLKLKLKDSSKINDEKVFTGKKIFLEIELNNGFTFREVYWIKSKIFHNGAIGNDEINAIIGQENDLIK